MNCLREEDFLRSSLVHPDATPLQAHSKPHHTASKFLSVFRSKRRSQEKPATTFDFEAPNNHTTARFYSATDNTSRQFRGHDLVGKTPVPPVSRMNTSTVSTGSGIQVDGGGIRSRVREFGPQRGKLSNEYMMNHESFAKPETVTVAIAQKQGSAAQPEVGIGVLPKSAQDVGNQFDVLRDMKVNPEVTSPVTSVTLPTFSRFLNQTGSDGPPHWTPGRRRAQGQIPLPSLSPVASSEDGAPIDSHLHFRRKSLPSIVKGPDSIYPSTKPEPNPNQSTTTPTSGGKPEVKASVASGSPPEPETIVIEDGVRKRVTPIYGPRSPVRALAVGGRAGLPKLYRIEATGAHGRGSEPDLTEAALEGVEVPSREVVYALSQQRREELARERLEADRIKGGQIILRLGDAKVRHSASFQFNVVESSLLCSEVWWNVVETILMQCSIYCTIVISTT